MGMVPFGTGWLNKRLKAMLVSGLVLWTGCRQYQAGLEPPAKTRLVRALGQEEDGLPGGQTTRLGPFLFFSDQPLSQFPDLIEGLDTLPQDISRELGIPISQRMVKVYVFSEKDHFQEYVGQKYPLLPNRRAYFIAQKRAAGLAEDLVVLTVQSPRIKQDLRHELTHALLHGVLKQVPLWLDEGIAEYFETEPHQNGFNAAHLEGLQRQWSSGAGPDLDRLESLSEVQQMHREEYREAWAWVYWMLRQSPEGKEALKAYLAQCKQVKSPKKLMDGLREKMPEPNQVMLNSMGLLDYTLGPKTNQPGSRTLPAGKRMFMETSTETPQPNGFLVKP